MEISINEQLKLRHWKKEDAVELQRIADNPNVAKNLRDRFPSPYTIEDAERWITLNEIALQKFFFCIEYQGKPAGGIGLDIQGDMHRFTAELGYWLGEEYWGKGIATASIKAITVYALKSLNLKRIYATASIKNVASVKAMEKAGYVFEGILKKYAYKNGEDIDAAMFAMTL